MKIIYKYSLVLIVLVNSMTSFVNAQQTDVKKIMNKVADIYEDKQQYHIAITYDMHRGLKGNNITESYEGEMIKNGAYSNFQALNSEVIQFPKEQLIIEHDTKNITYIKMKGHTLAGSASPIDMTGFLTHYDKTKVVEKNGKFICELVSTKQNIQIPYSKVVLYINKENYHIEKQELFFATLVPFVDQKTNERKSDYGRLVITLDYQELVEQSAPKLKDYFSFSSTKRVISVSYTHLTLPTNREV